MHESESTCNGVKHEGLLNWHPESLSLLRYQTKLDIPLTTAGNSNMNLIGKYQNAYLIEEISQWLKQTKVTKIPEMINNAPNIDKNINEIESKLSRDNRTNIYFD